MRKIFMSLLASVSLISVFSTSALAEFSADEKSALNALFESYIKENPDVVRQALIDLAQAEEQAQRAQAMTMLDMNEGDPFMGAGDDADIIIYEFSDYNCGYCKRVFAQLQLVLADDPKVRLILKEYPILAESSIEAARAAIAAQMQGKFEDFHISMMNWRGGISTDTILSIAAESGLDVTRLMADMQKSAVDNILARTRATAQSLDVTGTPALVIGTEFIGGAVSADQIKQVIAEQRAAKAS